MRRQNRFRGRFLLSPPAPRLFPGRLFRRFLSRLPFRWGGSFLRLRRGFSAGVLLSRAVLLRRFGRLLFPGILGALLLGGRGLQNLHRIRMIVHRRDLLADQLLNIRQIFLFVEITERDRDAGLSRTAGTPDAVHVCLRHVGKIVVDHMGKFLNIDPARGDIRGDKHADFAVLKRSQRLLTRVLRLIPVDGARMDPRTGKVAHHAVRAVLGAGKHERRHNRRVLQQMDQQAAFIGLVHKIDALRDSLHRSSLRRDLHTDGMMQEGIHKLHNFGRHCRGEKERLLFLRQLRDHLFHIVDKAHIEHSVRFVEHKDLHAAEIHNPLTDQIVEPARGCDQNFHAAPQAFHLRVLRYAAEHDGAVQGKILPVCTKTLVIL